MRVTNSRRLTASPKGQSRAFIPHTQQFRGSVGWPDGSWPTGLGKLQIQQCPKCPVSDGRPEEGSLSRRAMKRLLSIVHQTVRDRAPSPESCKITTLFPKTQLGTSGRSRRQLVEESLSLFQIERVEAFGKPAVDRSKKLASLIPSPLRLSRSNQLTDYN